MQQEDYLIRLIRRALAVLVAARAARAAARTAEAREHLDQESRRLTGLTLPMLQRLHGRALDPVIAPDGLLEPGRTAAVALLLAEAGTLAELAGDAEGADRLRERALGLWCRLWAALEAAETTAPMAIGGDLLAEVVALTGAVRTARLSRAQRRALVELLAQAGAVDAVEDELFALLEEGALDRPRATQLLDRLARAAPDEAAAVQELQDEVGERFAAPGGSP